MTRAIILAGIIGGLLGGLASFAAGRILTRPKLTLTTPDARAVADAYVAKLKAAKFEEFAKDVKDGLGLTTDAEFQGFKKLMSDNRLNYVQKYGPSTGEFEFLKETSLSPSLSRYVYLERFERGGVFWLFVIYRGNDGWRLSWVEYGGHLTSIFSGLP